MRLPSPLGEVLTAGGLARGLSNASAGGEPGTIIDGAVDAGRSAALLGTRGIGGQEVYTGAVPGQDVVEGLVAGLCSSLLWRLTLGRSAHRPPVARTETKV